MKKRILAVVMALVFAFGLTGLALAGNVANITQVGDLNVANTTQTGDLNVANTSQYGRNVGNIDQVGKNNDATIGQGAPGSPVDNYKQPGYVGDWINGAYIKQDGNSNSASIIERRSSTYAHIYQVGDYNFGSQDIDTYESKANSNFIPHRGVQIDQVGDSNEAYQTTVASFGCYGIQDMQIFQQGDSNYANQYSKGGMASVMEIFQTGDLNISFQYQDGRFSRAHASMIGDNNYTDQYQEYTVWSISGQNKADIDIVGSNNIATQYQKGEYNEAHIYQNGDFNSVSQTQTGDGNYASASQFGNNNSITQTQTGNGHSSTVTQTGNWNVAVVTQNP